MGGEEKGREGSAEMEEGLKHPVVVLVGGTEDSVSTRVAAPPGRNNLLGLHFHIWERSRSSSGGGTKEN